MNNNKHVSQFKDKILEKIKSEEVKMKPKMYFVFTSMLYIVGLTLGTIFTVYLLSFLLYFFTSQSLEHTRNFGLYGIKIFLISLPWIIILLSIILFIILEILVRHFKFGYKKPIIYSLSAIIIFMSLTSLVIAKTSLYNHMPMIGNLSEHYKHLEYMHRGVAIDVKPKRFILQDLNNQNKHVVIITNKTRLKPGLQVNNGDRVMVIGKEQDDEIIAEGIHLFEKNDRYMRNMREMHKEMQKEIMGRDNMK